MRNCTVLYIDASIGFGGSSKSLSLTLKAVPHVDKLVYTTQTPAIVEELFDGYEVRSFRRWINYRTKDRFREFLEARRLPGIVQVVGLKLYAMIDLVTAWANVARFWWVIRQRHIDIVHLNNGFFPEALWAAHLAGVPSIVHLRGFPDWRPGAGARKRAVRVGCVIAVSDAVAADVHSFVPDEIVTTVYDPVDIEVSDAAIPGRQRTREGLGAIDTDIVAGIFGRVVPWKGQKEFVIAMLKALEANPALLGVIVGDASDGSDAYLNEVESLIASSRFADRFVLTGYRADVAELYAALDIGVHASITPEPFGMVVPEAMAAGVAVIAADAGGPREIVRHGVDGLLVPPGDTDAFAAALLDLAADPERRRSMGKKAYASVRTRFTIENNAAGVVRVYEQLLGRRCIAHEPSASTTMAAAAGAGATFE